MNPNDIRIAEIFSLAAIFSTLLIAAAYYLFIKPERKKK